MNRMTPTFKASFYTLGCRLNQAETSLISNTFKDKGYEIVAYGDNSDVCIINSCTVTEQADSKCRQLVRQILNRSPSTFIAVVGCYSQMSAQALTDIEGIDLIIGNEDKMRVSEFIDIPEKLPEPIVRTGKISRSPFTISSIGNYEHATRANLKIQDGCDFMCSFCIIPFARGRSRSRALWDIQREAVALVARGHQEVVLSGVNIGTYDFEGKKLLDVIKMLETIEGLHRIRISSIEPTTIPDELVDYMASSAKLCNHLHIPMQHGDDSVLNDMRRVYCVQEYIEFVSSIKERIPDVCLGTDVMVGFPNETEAAFDNTYQLLNQLPIAYFHVFPFSERPGTAALKMSDRVSSELKKVRGDLLRKLSNNKKHKFYKAQIGTKKRVLIEQRTDDGICRGFTDNYVKVGVKTERNIVNCLLNVELRDMQESHLVTGRLTSDVQNLHTPKLSPKPR